LNLRAAVVAWFSQMLQIHEPTSKKEAWNFAFNSDSQTEKKREGREKTETILLYTLANKA